MSTPVLESILISEPEMMKVMLSLSISVAVTVPIAVWFSFTLKLADEVKLGSLSLRLLMLTDMDCDDQLFPSVAVTVAEYDVVVS